MRTHALALVWVLSLLCAQHTRAGLDAYDYDAFTLEKEPLEIDLRIQSRYAFNSRDADGTTLGNRENDVTTGFVLRRVNINIEGDITDRLRGRVRVAVDRGTGDLQQEYAYLSYKLTDDITFRAGLIRAKIIREEYVSASYQLAVERSAGNETVNQGFAEGIDLTITKDGWRAFFSITDGFGSNSTIITNPGEADFAVSSRVELRFGDAPWSSYKQFTSFRGAVPGVMVGAAAAYQFMSDTNPSTVADVAMTTLTGDVSVLGDGWNMYGSAVLNHNRLDTGPDLTDLILLLQGGFFISDQDELFARWNGIFPDSDNAPRGEEFHAVTAGWNHYLIPESHAAKFTLDVVVTLDPTTTSIVRTSDGHNLFPDSESGQVAITAQMQILF